MGRRSSSAKRENLREKEDTLKNQIKVSSEGGYRGWGSRGHKRAKRDRLQEKETLKKLIKLSSEGGSREVGEGRRGGGGGGLKHKRGWPHEKEQTLKKQIKVSFEGFQGAQIPPPRLLMLTEKSLQITLLSLFSHWTQTTICDIFVRALLPGIRQLPGWGAGRVGRFTADDKTRHQAARSRQNQ